jgi:hypothetical protein
MCKRDILIGILFLLISLKCQAIERNFGGAREAALSQAVVALSGSFSVFHNQACLTESRYPSIGVSYRRPYSVKGYNESALALVYPYVFSVFAIGIMQSSVGAYSESNFGLSIAKALTRKLSTSLLFNYFTLNLPEAGRHKGSFQVDGGVRYICSDRLSLGLHLKNMIFSKIETFQYELAFPLVIRAGASSRLSESLLLNGEAVFQRGYDIIIRCGTEYLLRNNFLVRAGISTQPFQHSFGFGYIWSRCQLDFAMVHHELLGYTPLFSLTFNFNR